MTPIDPFQQFLFFDLTCGPSYRAGKGPIIGKKVKNDGLGSMIWITNLLEFLDIEPEIDVIDTVRTDI